MKIVCDKYVRKWLMRYSTFILLNINHTGVIAQSSIITAGNQTETIGEVFPIMQTDLKEKEISLGVPRFEAPTQAPKPKIKPPTFWQKLILTIKKLFK